jgi:phage gpG-like protein
MAKRRSGPTLIQQSRRVPAEEKALYHQELGAGRSRVKRPFLGLTADDEKAIVARIEAAVDKRIKDLA